MLVGYCITIIRKKQTEVLLFDLIILGGIKNAIKAVYSDESKISLKLSNVVYLQVILWYISRMIMSSPDGVYWCSSWSIAVVKEQGCLIDWKE